MDIVERLRDGCSCNIDETPCMAESECREAYEAADEITRLRAENERLREALEDIADGMGETDSKDIGRFAPAVARAALHEGREDG